MGNQTKSFPPPKIDDLDRQSASNYLALLRDLRKHPTSLILGAGASASAGVPIWRDFLQRVCAAFFEHWSSGTRYNKFDISTPPKEMSIVFIDPVFWSQLSMQLSEELMRTDFLLVAQQIKNCIRDIDWRYLLRKILYNYDILGEPEIEDSDLLLSLSNLCKESRKIQSVINYNYDNTFEMQLKNQGVKHNSIWEGKGHSDKNSIPIFHPHGLITLEGGPITRIILAESEYQHEFSEPYSWANLIQFQYLSNSLCVFIGSSLTDPNLRRLLRLSSNVNPLFKYAFLPTEKEKSQTEIMFEALFDNDLLKLDVKAIRYPIDSSKEDPFFRLPELIDLMRIHLEDRESIWL